MNDQNVANVLYMLILGYLQLRAASWATEGDGKASFRSSFGCTCWFNSWSGLALLLRGMRPIRDRSALEGCLSPVEDGTSCWDGEWWTGCSSMMLELLLLEEGDMEGNFGSVKFENCSNWPWTWVQYSNAGIEHQLLPEQNADLMRNLPRVRRIRILVLIICPQARQTWTYTSMPIVYPLRVWLWVNLAKRDRRRLESRLFRLPM
jgi:hypothetical protein